MCFSPLLANAAGITALAEIREHGSCVHAAILPHHIFSAIESKGSNGLISSARILRRLITIRS